MLALTVICGADPSVTAPVPMLRDCVPVKVKFPFQVCGLLLARVIGPPEELSMVVPPAIVSLEAVAPMAAVPFIFSVPALRFVPPK